MGVRLPRTKPRSVLASVAYRLGQFLPDGTILDLAAITDRIARDRASQQGANIWGENSFLHKHINPDDRVIEIGCNTGRVLSTVDARVRVGVDTNRHAIEQGRILHPHLTLIHAEAREYLRQAEPFDVLILSHVLEHIDEPEKFLGVVSERFDRVYIEVPDFECNALNPVRVERGRSLLYTDDDHVAEFDRRELQGMLEGAGLEVMDSEFKWGFMRYWASSTRTGGGEKG